MAADHRRIGEGAIAAAIDAAPCAPALLKLAAGTVGALSTAA